MRARADAGVTLIEMVVVVALFAVVALIGTQALRLTLRYQEDLSRHAVAADDLAVGLQLLRHDLAAAVALGGAPGAVSLTLAGVQDPEAPDITGLARVVWRLDRGARTLTRTQTAPEAVQPGIAQPVFADVADFDLLALSADGWAPAHPGIEDLRGLDARLVTDTGPLRVLVVQ